MDRPSLRFFPQHERDPVLSIGSTKKVMNGVLDDEPMDEGDYEIGYGLYGGGGAGSGTAVEENGGGGGSSPSLGKGGEAQVVGGGGGPVSMAVPSNPMNHLELDDYYGEEDGEEEGKEEVGGGGGEGSRGDDLEGLRYSASVYRLSRTGNRIRKGKGVGKLGEQTDNSFCHIFMVKRIFVTLFVPVSLYPSSSRCGQQHPGSPSQAGQGHQGRVVRGGPKGHEHDKQCQGHGPAGGKQDQALIEFHE